MGKSYVIAKYLTGEDIKRVRELLGMTQKEFAAFVGCAVRTVENWGGTPLWVGWTKEFRTRRDNRMILLDMRG